ncbi:M3 family oligoendopeptidase [Peloplasma aerotolerans]|uniref:M3 family oligoendopeptidase n=1 Tax=Peloplasma aerotolerans TaxID=3044389 RepID=A0AAW6UA41_9MOLU|nr:M3 family oligoendopeptidase [Mariniplasma sp. M4Ah]MDI6453297.1 M3 family oligoendopeptidase [Mariniplasma sp. M4Ah]
MKFNDYKYERPNLDEIKKEIEEQLNLISTDQDLQTEIQAVHKVFAINDKLNTMGTLVSIRNSVDTTDEFYEKEQEFFDENTPHLRQYEHQFNEKILASKNRKELEKEFGELIFLRGELAQKTFKPEIIPEMQKENKLTTEYGKLIASAKIEFQGGTYNLSQMTPFIQDKDRETRHQAQLAVSKFFADNESQFDRIYDDMVKVRHEMAEKLGYENFIQLGYDRFGRTDYTAEDVKNYRDQIYSDIVPLVTELTERKAKRLNIENPKSYDLALSFLSGNPTPKGNREWQVSIAKNMYDEMSPETSEFFNFMLDRELLDLDSKSGKQGGGYCTYIPEYRSPFIFANFNGTSHDVDVLTHEAGHAFQVYQSRDQIPEYRWPTMEAAEIHSMSMEFLAWPWIDQFFKEDTKKYKFNHLAGAVSFLPYGVLVDEFQHHIYEKPELSPDERKALWRKLEKKYMPFKDYGDDAFMEKGTFWFRQGHIFHAPFYYIDYTLAQICAFQYWIKHQENREEALKSYLNLCRLGGSKSFLGLVEVAKLKNPFIKGTVKEIVKPIRAYLDSVDDTKL